VSYQRFDLAAALRSWETALATVATNATDPGAPSETVASVATVAISLLDPTPPANEAQTRFGNGEGVPQDLQLSDAAWDTDDWHAYFAERAAVLEFDYGLSREDAEGHAFRDTVVQWLCRYPAQVSNPALGCVHCCSRDQAGNTLLPLLAEGGHVWVHDRCWEPWNAARQRQAADALYQLGLRVSSPCPQH
jgi:hypothetical protein